jgi:hypothetical protein
MLPCYEDRCETTPRRALIHLIFDMETDMKSNVRNCFLTALIALGTATHCMAAGDANISWATTLESSAGGHGPNVLGKPDYGFATIGRYANVWAKDFKPPVLYRDLLSLLNGSFAGSSITTPITEADLRRYDVIAFEGNGGSPAGAGGWESGIWLFSDLYRAYAETFNETTGVGTITSGRRARFKTGSIYCYQYQAFFPGASAPCGNAKDVVSWILIDVPNDINVRSPHFSVWLSGVNPFWPYADPVMGEGAPDPDAIGILSRP